MKNVFNFFSPKNVFIAAEKILPLDFLVYVKGVRHKINLYFSQKMIPIVAENAKILKNQKKIVPIV